MTDDVATVAAGAAGYLHVHSPTVTDRSITAGHCSDCKRRTRFLAFFQDWYGWNHTCLRCGRVWDDGEWTALPFVRGARQKNIGAAKRRWRRLRDHILKEQKGC